MRWWLMVVMAAGCGGTHRSSLGTVVTDVQLHGSTLYVERCTVGYAVTDTTAENVAVSLVLLPILLVSKSNVGPDGSNESRTIERTGCHGTDTTLGVLNGAP